MNKHHTKREEMFFEHEYKNILYRCALLLLGVSAALTEEESITVSLNTDRRPTKLRSTGSS